MSQKKPKKTDVSRALQQNEKHTIVLKKNCDYFAHDFMTITTQKMKISIKDSFSKCNQIRSFLRIWSHLLKKILSGKDFFVCSECKLVS